MARVSSHVFDKLLCHDGLGDFLGHTNCSHCGKVPRIIKCKDCLSGRLLKCPECIVILHQSLPLHRVDVSCNLTESPDGSQSPDDFLQRWNGLFFDNDSLQQLGLCYQVGHSGGVCPFPQAGPKNFVVLDISGPHFITIDYCNCGDEPLTNWVQLLREKWFPATLSCLQSVFTFDCLETFHELTLQGKTSLYDYYNTLLWRFDNAGISNPIVSSTFHSSTYSYWTPGVQ